MRRYHGKYSRGPTLTRALRRHLREVLHEPKPKRQTEVRPVKVVVFGLGVGVRKSASWME